MLVVDLLGDEPIPEDPRYRAEQGTGVGPEAAGDDECDLDAAAERGPPRDGVVQPRDAGSRSVRRPASKSAWIAEAVGSDWPWYFDPSPSEP